MYLPLTPVLLGVVSPASLCSLSINCEFLLSNRSLPFVATFVALFVLSLFSLLSLMSTPTPTPTPTVLPAALTQQVPHTSHLSASGSFAYVQRLHHHDCGVEVPTGEVAAVVGADEGAVAGAMVVAVGVVGVIEG